MLTADDQAIMNRLPIKVHALYATSDVASFIAARDALRFNHSFVDAVCNAELARCLLEWRAVHGAS